ncbi:lysine transporter LysE [Halarcobacter ebronensis]|uniref:Lysine transporter LysE n=1 Tax=Halarcobacter ebronensis TaxID=1462615 RepID=A0A4Q0YG29_9BACT|nr:LysE family translocator [Halarcobacter ebronensis]RXJ69532.1 lysine transporter LysE [Halarcobacter ebronensis]
MGITDLYLFIIAGLLLNITPGADMLYILKSSFQRGFKGGVVSSFGVSFGCFVHVFLAASGLSALLHSSDTAFMIVKYLGVIYLIYLGVSLLISVEKKIDINVNQKDTQKIKKLFWQGFFINVLNPKVALFFITFLPQFIDINNQHKVLAPFILGVIFIFFGTIVNIAISFFAIRVSSNMRVSTFISTLVKKVVGLLFIGFGLKLAMEKI